MKKYIEPSVLLLMIASEDILNTSPNKTLDVISGLTEGDGNTINSSEW